MLFDLEIRLFNIFWAFGEREEEEGSDSSKSEIKEIFSEVTIDSKFIRILSKIT